MANSEHLAILKQGVQAWNRWRDEHYGVLPDLVRADLSKAQLGDADLRGAKLGWADLSEAILSRVDLRWAGLVGANLSRVDLRWADLSGATLSGAHLDGAKLTRADLSEATLSGAHLDGANLSRVDLHWADLSEATLSGADLSGANLTGASLWRADFDNAIAGFTAFASVDLSIVRGLERVRHGYPSTIGIDTLYRSHGNIPESFLRGCGVPDQFIEYARSLTGRPIEYYSCFISYSFKDEDFAKRLYADLQANNVRCWLASEDMKTGDEIRETVDRMIRYHDRVLLVLSETSVNSPWVKHEVENALELERKRKRPLLFPVRLDDAVMRKRVGWATDVRRRLITDFSAWRDHDAYTAAFDRLLRDLKAGAD